MAKCFRSREVKWGKRLVAVTGFALLFPFSIKIVVSPGRRAATSIASTSRRRRRRRDDNGVALRRVQLSVANDRPYLRASGVLYSGKCSANALELCEATRKEWYVTIHRCGLGVSKTGICIWRGVMPKRLVGKAGALAALALISARSTRR